MFDCRVFHVPDIGEAANAVLWRVQDASKNAISMVARSHFSTSDLHGKSTVDRLQMLHDAGVAYDKLPAFFRHGSFWQRQSIKRVLTEEEWLTIPKKARLPLGHEVVRSQVQRVSMPGDRITYYDIEPLLLRE
jgi:tRNA(His) 5'-end guanylyltransferase